ncbi:MAG: HAD family hydrolase [Coriobacteriales bacterium]|jgi:putative hydrolase of the HAD superfamily|nr:HAD family hydrolase [Coriobacteriales bacterium]
MVKGIQTVFFDVGSTLLKPATPVSDVLVRVAARLGAHVDPVLAARSVPRMFAYYEELYNADNSLWADEECAINVWLTIYSYLCELVGIPEIGPQVARLTFEEFLNPSNWVPFDDVLPTLSALKERGIALGLISNWDSSLENVIAGVGISSYFDVTVASTVVGLYKPQPEIFRFALNEMGAHASDTMHVGDHPQADAEGAAGVGITPVLIDRNNLHGDSEAYIRIQNLQELIEYL